jgi:hypothetical protein
MGLSFAAQECKILRGNFVDWQNWVNFQSPISVLMVDERMSGE